MSKLVVILSVIFLVLIISTVIYLYIKSKKTALVNLQNKIMSLINGKTTLNNLKVIGSLNIVSSNQNDKYPLKLLSSSKNKNVITFSRYGVPYNEFGVIANPSTPSSTPSSYKPILLDSNIQTPSDLSIASLQQQINDIVSGKTQLNNLYVMNKLTVVSSGGHLKSVGGLNALNGGLSVINTSGDSTLDSLILFKGNAGEGQYGVSQAYSNVYDIYSSNVNYKYSSWDSRSVLPTCSPSGNPTIQPTLPTVTHLKSLLYMGIQSLEKQLDDIVNGNTPINNLVVNGYVVVDSTLDSPLILDVQSCDATSLVGFNNVGARGVNAYGGPFDWVSGYFTSNISYSGNLRAVVPSVPSG